MLQTFTGDRKPLWNVLFQVEDYRSVHVVKTLYTAGESLKHKFSFSFPVRRVLHAVRGS